MLTVTINGREAVPLRAVPYVTHGFLDIRRVAAALFDPEGFDEGWGFATGFPRARRLLAANQVEDLRAGSHRIWAEACTDSNLNGNSLDLIKLAPAEYFVWRDELESCFRAMDKELDDRAAAITGYEPFESRAFAVDAYVAPTERDVIMEGFQQPPAAAVRSGSGKTTKQLGIDLQLQAEAEQVAQELKQARGPLSSKLPSRREVATALARKHRLSDGTVQRRIRATWKKKSR